MRTKADLGRCARPGRLARTGPAKLESALRGVNSTLVLSLLAAAACYHPPRAVPAVPPGNWRMWLGAPNRAVYADQPIPDQVTVAWRSSAGHGLEAPVVVQRPVVVAATTGRTITTLSAETGGHYWGHRFRGAVIGPVLRLGDRLFVVTGGRDDRVYALTLERGRKLWSERIGRARVGGILSGDTLFVAVASRRVVALGSDGHVYWRTRLPAEASSPPLPWAGDLLVSTEADTLYRLRRSDGRVQARLALPAEVSAPALMRGDTVYLPLRSGELMAVRLPDLQEAGRYPLGSPILAAPVANPAGGIFVLTRDAVVWRVDPGQPARRLVSLSGAATRSLTLARNRLLVGRLDGALFCLDLTGDVIWQLELGRSIAAPVTVNAKEIFVPLLDGHVVKLK